MVVSLRYKIPPFEILNWSTDQYNLVLAYLLKESREREKALKNIRG